MGRLRPSFASKCLGGQRPYTEKMILNDQECTEKGTELTDSRRSFPSGHASLAVGGAAYAQLCAVRASRKGLGSWVFIAGWIVMGGGFWVAASRVVDGAHHVGDIAVGALMGIWAALVQFFWVVGRNNVAIQEAQIEVQVERDE